MNRSSYQLSVVSSQLAERELSKRPDLVLAEVSEKGLALSLDSIGKHTRPGLSHALHPTRKAWSFASLFTHHFKPKLGFSLIEVMLAVVIIGALATLLYSTSGTLFATRRSKLQSVAAKIASKDIEYMRSLAFASLPPTGPCTPPTSTDPDLQQLKEPRYCTRTIVNYDLDGPGPLLAIADIKQVSITISWKGDKGANESLTMDTLIYKDRK